MKILQVYKDFQPIGGGGVARYIHGLSTVIADRGHEVRVAVLPSGGVVPVKGAAYRAEPVAPPALAQLVAWADIVHLHGARNRYVHCAARDAKRIGKPFIFTPHCYYDHGNILRRGLKWVWDRTFERKLVAQAHAMILLHANLIEDARKRSLPVDRAVVMPTPILWAELSVNAGGHVTLSGSPSILSISRVDAIKRLDDVIKAVASGKKLASAHLHIVGKGQHREALGSLAKRLGVSDRVHFHGFLPDIEAMAMLNAADVFVLASEREGMPATLIEALLVGCPVVASDIQGNRHVLETWGLENNLVPLGDFDALAQKLAEVAAQGRIEDELRMRVHALHTWEGAAAALEQIYEAALKNDGR
jgi:glycosyltransferase involved in cell wall biosynthesis